MIDGEPDAYWDVKKIISTMKNNSIPVQPRFKVGSNGYKSADLALTLR